MNARTVNISSLVILLALLSLICEDFILFLPSPIWSIVFAVLVSLALSHFFWNHPLAIPIMCSTLHL